MMSDQATTMTVHLPLHSWVVNLAEKCPHRIVALLGSLCLLAYIITIPLPRIDGNLIGSDGVFYYAFLPSIWLDHDLDMANQYRQLLPAERINLMHPTSNGLLPNDYAVGAALLWSPFFLSAHAISLVINHAGMRVSLDGTSYLYQAITMIGSIVYGCIGLWLMTISYRRIVSHRAAIMASVLLWFITNIIYYMVVEPSMSHMVSLFTVSLFVATWMKTRVSSSLVRWATLGATGGLIMLVRLPDATILILPVIEHMISTRIWEKPSRVVSALGQYTVFGIAAVAVFTPQMVVWYFFNGSPFISGYLITAQPTFNWLQPHLLDVLVSPFHGLWLWHPITLIAAIGFLWLYRQHRSLTILLLLGFLMQVYVIGAWRDWYQGDAFGGRMFIASIPILGFGLASLLDQPFIARHWKATFAIFAVLLGWNVLFAMQYRLGYIPMGAPITAHQMFAGKFEMITDIIRQVLQLLKR